MSGGRLVAFFTASNLLPVGANFIVAQFSAACPFNASSSSNVLPTLFGHQVNADNTSTAITVPTARQTSTGQNVLFQATVTNTTVGTVVPTGSVYFFVDGSTTPYAGITGVSSGKLVAVFSTPSLSVSTHNIVADYFDPAHNFASSGSRRFLRPGDRGQHEHGDYHADGTSSSTVGRTLCGLRNQP